MKGQCAGIHPALTCWWLTVSKAEAYCSIMLGKENKKFGWDCVSQATGTAAWMDMVSTQYLLGVRLTLKGLPIGSSVPAEWGRLMQRIFTVDIGTTSCAFRDKEEFPLEGGARFLLTICVKTHIIGIEKEMVVLWPI